MSCFINNFQWSIPWEKDQLFPNLRNLVQQVTTLMQPKEDCLVWKSSFDGDLSLKATYEFKRKKMGNLHWAKTISS